jgi:hypothetical protein
LADWTFGNVLELWIMEESLLARVFCARNPNTNSIESITFDLPLPFGPTMLVKLLWKGPST